jgi:glycosyltransferase involved in cell wall biosynthesis
LKEIRVLYIVTAFPRHEKDVITPWLWTLIRELMKRGVKAEVLASSYRGMGDGELWGIRVHRWRYAPARWETLSHDVAIFEKLRSSPLNYLLVPFFLIGGYLSACRLARRGGYNLIHVSWAIPFSLLAIPFKKIPWVFTFHHSELTIADRFPFLKTLFSGILKKAPVITVNSTFTRRELLERFPELGRVEVVPWPPGWEIPQELPPREKNRVLFVGRLVEWKGVDYLLEGFKIVSGHLSDVELIIVGDGPERKRLVEKAGNLGIEGKVAFLGWKVGHELIEEYARASVLVVPSIVDYKGQTESLGVVAIEAMAMGTPVVASRVGGLTDVVADGETGFLLPQKNPEALALAIENILTNEEVAREMSLKARERFKRMFSSQSIADRFVQLYQELLNEPDD